MCGLIGSVGKKQVVPVIMDCLSHCNCSLTILLWGAGVMWTSPGILPNLSR